MMNNQSFIALCKHRYWYESLWLIITDEQEPDFSDIISVSNVELFVRVIVYETKIIYHIFALKYTSN